MFGIKGPIYHVLVWACPGHDQSPISGTTKGKLAIYLGAKENRGVCSIQDLRMILPWCPGAPSLGTITSGYCTVVLYKRTLQYVLYISMYQARSKRGRGRAHPWRQKACRAGQSGQSAAVSLGWLSGTRGNSADSGKLRSSTETESRGRERINISTPPHDPGPGRCEQCKPNLQVATPRER